MIIQRVGRDEPENIFMVVTNVSASSITQGFAAQMAIAGNSFDGKNAVLGGVGATGFIGIAKRDIPVNGIGLVQCWGFAASVYLSNVGTSLTINQGDPLVPGALPGGMFSAAPTYANAGLKYVLASNVPAAVSAISYCSGWVRCI